MRVAEFPISDPQWAGFVSSRPDAGPLHLPEWASTIADCYGFEALVLGVLDADGELISGVPTVAVRSLFGRTRWISLPFSDSCPLLVRPEAPVDRVVEAIRDYVLASEVRDLELRATLPEGEGFWPRTVGYYHSLELPRDPADLTPNKGHRNLRNRAMRAGVAVERGTSKDDVDRFYRLHTLTRRRHGVPVQPRRFFDVLWERLIDTGHGYVSTATLNGDVLAAAVYLHHNGTLTAKYQASDPGKPDVHAGYLLDWQNMVDACEKGYRTLDWGRSDPDANGLRLYKSSWGIPESELVYTRIAPAPSPTDASGGGGWYHGVIRHSPLWVCRALGELFYRWAA